MTQTLDIEKELAEILSVHNRTSTDTKILA